MEVVEGRTAGVDIDAIVADLAAIGEEYGAVVQAFDARYVVGREHLRRAVDLAERARGRGEGIAEDPAMEVLLYAAGCRQITEALEIGIPENGPVVAVIARGDETAAARAVADLLEPADVLGAYDPDRVRSFYEITDRELGATAGNLADAALERVALLPVNR